MHSSKYEELAANENKKGNEKNSSKKVFLLNLKMNACERGKKKEVSCDCPFESIFVA